MSFVRRGALQRETRSLLAEYSDSSTIHGVKYLGGPRRRWPERLWWLLAFGASLYTCGALILNTYTKWSTDPVIVSFSQTPTPLWRIPFPSVTICPLNLVRQSVFNFTDVLTRLEDDSTTNLTDTDVQQLRTLSLICYDYNLKHLRDVPGFWINVTDEDCYQLMDQVVLREKDLFDMFIWKGSNKTYLSTIVTEAGLCFAFNMMTNTRIFRDDVIYFSKPNSNMATLKELDWTPEKGFPRDTGLDQFPFRFVNGGTGNSLELALTTDPADYDFLCEGPFQGYNVLINTPVEVPSINGGYVRVPSNQETLIMLKPHLIHTSNTLRSYEPSGRQCYYESERYLRFFRVYTQLNCEMECVTNYTLTKCGCAAFYLPRLAGTEICGPAKIKCYREAVEDLNNVAVDGVKDLEADEKTPICNCLPSCTYLTYDSEISYGDVSFKGHYRSNTYFASGTKENVSYAYIMLFFKEDQFISLRRGELFGKTDFVANCGGLLGLFMGVSLLSIVEIFYFCTIRLLYRLKDHREIITARDQST
ncbi:pickpocket protein 28-like [Phlebotomus argentipes]|uniref:pickpocket protein 28-like n=1 Tax=Phlebotomus argentipes TaxID=94469 RepID=UPI002892FAD3|nr:pickpocket protein 28-like [Phlebotomus argentipes]